MGLPDFLKFVARSAPSALHRLPKHVDANAKPVFEFDYVLIDATNVSQTIGFERVHALLTSPLIAVHKAVIFALDAQRDRAGTDRFHRQAHIMVGDLDVQVQSCCTKLVDAYKKKAEDKSTEPRPSPLVLMSGRHVAGEADYKLLDLHRNIVCAALASGQESPRFLFVSEDSDILCGALCGPAPQSTFIATNLRDTLFELGLLQVSHVVAYVALCIDALAAPPAREEPAQITTDAVEEEDASPVEDTVVEAAVPEVTPTEPVQRAVEDDVVRRRKQDGPMVATGVRIALDDSSSDDDEPAKVPPKATTTPATAVAVSQPAPTTATSLLAVAAPPATPALPSLEDPEAPAATMIHDSSVDFVFLFLVVMGNGGNVPPLVRGSTKVDVGSCWQAYCAKKFTNAMGQEAQLGKTLLQIDGALPRGGEDHAVVRVNCHFFRAILEALHYADAQSRPPAEEEKGRALAYLSSAVYATLRYVVGCNVSTGPGLVETFLDTRPLSDVEVFAPSLSAVLWLLSQDQWRQFSYPLRGLTRKELVALRDRHSREEDSGRVVGASRHNQPPQQANEGAASSAAAATARGHAHGEQKRLQMDVCAALVAPPASSSSWAVRGAGSRTYTLAAVMATGSDSDASRVAAPTPTSTRQVTNVAAQLRRLAPSLGKTATSPLVELLLTTWRLTEVPAVSVFRGIAATAAFLSPVTNTFVDGPLSRGKAWQGVATQTASAAAAMVYSFELRRMVPVAASHDAEQTTTTLRDTTQSAAAGQSRMNDALRAALGLSLSYDKAPATAEADEARARTAKLPRQAMDEEDLAELNRLKKVARKEKDRFNKAMGQDASTAGSNKSKKGKSAKDKAEAAPAPAVKRAKRPGKKERQKRQREGTATEPAKAENEAHE